MIANFLCSYCTAHRAGERGAALTLPAKSLSVASGPIVTGHTMGP